MSSDQTGGWSVSVAMRNTVKQMKNEGSPLSTLKHGVSKQAVLTSQPYYVSLPEKKK
jgi:hypothetical protein